MSRTNGARSTRNLNLHHNLSVIECAACSGCRKCACICWAPDINRLAAWREISPLLGWEAERARLLP